MKKITIRIITCLFLIILFIMTVSCQGNGSKLPLAESSNSHTHEWSEWNIIREATCSSEGQSERTCPCGEKDTKITPLSHEWGEWSVIREATCSSEGQSERACPCGEKDTKILPIDNSNPLAHEWGDWSVIREATCSSEGQSERVCPCGEKDNDILPTLPHMGKDWVIDKEATLRESGKKHQVCSTCEKTINEETIPPVTVTVLSGTTDEYQDKLRPNYKLANCRNLNGSPVVVLIFIDDNESRWTKEEVITFTQDHILIGLDYLEKNAKEWGVDLDFKVESYSTALSGYEIKYEGTINPNLYVGGSTKDVLDKAARDIGCDSNWELYSYYKSKYPNDDIIFLNFVNKSGVSYARHAISTGYSTYSEHCVIFADYLGSSPDMRDTGSRASTVAHEILHLFGAEDFYASDSRELLASQIYPNDIMLWQFDDIELNWIGDCAAFSIGWTDTAPQVCFDSKWWK